MMGLRFAGCLCGFPGLARAPVFLLSVLLDIHLILLMLMLLNISAILVWMTSVL